LNPWQSENLDGGSPSSPISKKAEDIVVLDMRGLVAYTDFLAICTARNERQVGGSSMRCGAVKQDSGLLRAGATAAAKPVGR